MEMCNRFPGDRPSIFVPLRVTRVTARGRVRPCNRRLRVKISITECNGSRAIVTPEVTKGMFSLRYCGGGKAARAAKGVVTATHRCRSLFPFVGRILVGVSSSKMKKKIASRLGRVVVRRGFPFAVRILPIKGKQATRSGRRCSGEKARV